MVNEEFNICSGPGQQRWTTAPANANDTNEPDAFAIDTNTTASAPASANNTNEPVAIDTNTTATAPANANDTNEPDAFAIDTNTTAIEAYLSAHFANMTFL
jgi:hypothetical protein